MPSQTTPAPGTTPVAGATPVPQSSGGGWVGPIFIPFPFPMGGGGYYGGSGGYRGGGGVFLWLRSVSRPT